MIGTVLWFSSERGYGFILGEDENKYFLHRSNLVDIHFTPSEGDEVDFDFEDTNKGLLAIDVERIR